MFGNLKIGAKMSAGFGTLLVLLFVIAYVGYKGLVSVADRVKKADAVEDMVKHIREARQQEKNFIIRRDEKYIAQVNKEAKDVMDLAAATGDRLLTQQVHKTQMDSVVKAVTEYLTAFHAYADLERKKNSAMEEMRARTRDAITQVDAFWDEQKMQLANVKGTSAGQINDRLIKLDNATRIIKWFVEARKDEKEFIITKGDRSWSESHDKLMENIFKLTADLRQRSGREEDIKQIDGTIASLNTYQAAFERFRGYMQSQDDMEKQMLDCAREAEKACDDVWADQKSMMKIQIIKANRIMVAVGILALLVGSLLAIFVTRSIAVPLKAAVYTAGQIAAGDLTVNVPRQDRRDEVGELMEALRKMTENLQTQIKEMQEGINVLASSSGEISSSSAQLASVTAETAAAVNETTTTIEEVKQTALLSDEKAKYVSMTAQDAARISHSGKEVTEEAIESMAHIREQMDFIAQSTVGLSEQSQAIGEIIATVNDLAEQSNLLAVNASIEAAKAGDQGKGFAVVAHEVRSLADQSKQATSQIKGILNDIRKAISSTVLAAEQGSKAVGAGSGKTAEAGKSIEALANSISEAAQASIQIAASSQQQLIGMSQVASAMEDIRQAATQSMAGTRQLETLANNLNDLGQQLKESVSRYKV